MTDSASGKYKTKYQKLKDLYNDEQAAAKKELETLTTKVKNLTQEKETLTREKESLQESSKGKVCRLDEDSSEPKQSEPTKVLLSARTTTGVNIEIPKDKGVEKSSRASESPEKVKIKVLRKKLKEIYNDYKFRIGKMEQEMVFKDQKINNLEEFHSDLIKRYNDLRDDYREQRRMKR